MKLKSVLVLVVALCAPLMAVAEGKIAVLNVQEAILNTDLAQARLKEMRAKSEYTSNREQLETIKKAYEDAIKQLQKDAAVMNAEQKQAEAKKIQGKREDIEHIARKLQTAEQELAQAIIQDLAPTVQKIVTDMIEANGIGLLLDRKAAMHVDSSFSITAKVTDKLNQAK